MHFCGKMNNRHLFPYNGLGGNLEDIQYSRVLSFMSEELHTCTVLFFVTKGKFPLKQLALDLRERLGNTLTHIRSVRTNAIIKCSNLW